MESDESDTKRVTVRVPEGLVEDYEQSLDVKISRVVTDGGTQTAGHLDSDDETDLDVDDPEDAGAILDDLEAPGKEVAESAD
jgi:hypothetical protein